MRRLIVNADDFGLTRGVNRAILEAHQDGIVTSSTLMANGAEFAEAAALVRDADRLSVGCHVVLIDGAPVTPASSVPTLLGKDGASFRNSTAYFAISSLSRRLSEQEIEAEATAQIKKLQWAGVKVSHIDSHKHTHMFPAVLRPLLRAAKACGVNAVRNAFEPAAMSHLFGGSKLWKRTLQVKGLRTLAAKFRSAVKDAGMRTPDGTVGIVVTGVLQEQWLSVILENLPEGTWELVCHPGYNDAQLGGVNTRLRESRVIELRALTAPEARATLAKNGVELISYRDL